MKILHVITSLNTGGAEKLMVDLLPLLKKLGLDVDLCIFDGNFTPFYRDLQNQGIKIIDFGIGNHVYNPINIFRLRRILEEYDCIHTHNYAPQIFSVLASIGKNVKLITTEHGGSNRRRNYKLFSYIDLWMYRNYSKVICIAQKTLESLNLFTRNKLQNLTVINNGVDIKKFSEAHPSSDLDKLAPGCKKLIMVAGFRWEKDQDTVIRALKHLPENYHLYLVGDGVRRNELSKLSKELGVDTRLHFLGIRSDIPELLHASDFIIMSSHFEGLSLSSVEGMSVGKPFLASDVDGLREVVDGAGVLFPHQDSQALAKEILTLDNSEELYNKTAEACYKRALQFDISKMVEGYMNVYRNV